jgi:ethanolamine permease
LPNVLGHVHPIRRTSDVPILFWSLVVVGFVIWGYFNRSAVDIAVLTCNLTALIWYVLAMVCLFVLRRRDPHMLRPFKVPLYPVLPASVLVMSLFAAGIYGWYYHEDKPIVLWITLIMCALGLDYYVAFARRRLVSAAPEEPAARAGHEVK